MTLQQELASEVEAIGTAVVAVGDAVRGAVVVVPNLSYASHRLPLHDSSWIHSNHASVPKSSLPCFLGVLAAVVALTEEEANF